MPVSEKTTSKPPVLDLLLFGEPSNGRMLENSDSRREGVQVRWAGTEPWVTVTPDLLLAVRDQNRKQMQSPPTRPVLDVGTASPAYRHPADVSGWYGPARHLPNLFVPLAVLQTLSQLADGDGRVTVALASKEVPQGILHGMLRMLSLLGYIQTDGLTITVTRLPIKT